MPVAYHRNLLFPLYLLLLLLVVSLAGCSDEETHKNVTLEGDIFGTFYQVTIADPVDTGQVEEIEQGMLDVLHGIDMSMSTWKEDSELSTFNRSPIGEWQPLSPELMEVLDISRSVYQASGGAFDVTVGDLVNLWSFGPEARPKEIPDEATLEQRLSEVGMDAVELDMDKLEARRLRDVYVDLSGVAKGYATDKVAEYLESQGISNYMVNLGGEIKAKGHRNGETGLWRIGIEVPQDSTPKAQHIVGLSDVTVATSGDYRHYFEQDGKRYSHTIDPRTGRPITHRLASVTVFHSSNGWADAWATAINVLGEKEGMTLAIEEDLAVMLLVRNGDGWESWVSPAFVERFGEEMVDALGLKVVTE
ncbi:FAD:protein FMN transferase [Halomonas binhaiensis]|uniref:FAD:protein FMN transferase n=1 Tax=Halomonas binhaiensis TaxID=2562282 RepID=A0A5C1NMP4_9GAMM|nr:FAD:protein FMN transferase [Halomonas binhaiensis]QEM83697.1 FAD:protein FMN transferase [Halomonas binhaiensis]